MATFRDLCTDALYEIGACALSQPAAAADLQFTFGKLQRLIDNWNAVTAAVYATAFPQFTLVPNLAPHTIGPTGTWTVSQRPVSIEGAQLILTTVNPPITTPITLRDQTWWQQQSIPTLAIPYPTDVYYDATWPDGTLYFWPTPQLAYGVQLEIRIVLAAATVDNTYTMPPGYQDAITLTLQEMIATGLGRPIPDDLPGAARAARARIFDNNTFTPRIATYDAGMTPGRTRRSTWNYYTGETMPTSRG